MFTQQSPRRLRRQLFAAAALSGCLLTASTAKAATGWYLLFPPIGGPVAAPQGDTQRYYTAHHIDTSLPLWQWATIDVFDTALECKTRQKELSDQYGDTFNGEVAHEGVCVTAREVKWDVVLEGQLSPLGRETK
jgi:hypothetical protein